MKTNKVREAIYAQINEERDRQDVEYKEANKENTLSDWGCILGEENGEVLKEINDIRQKGKSTDDLKKELIQEGAVIFAILEHLEAQEDVIDVRAQTAEPKAIEACAVDADAESGESLYHFEVVYSYSFQHQNGDWHPTGNTRSFQKRFKSDVDAFAFINQNYKEIFAEFEPNTALSGWYLKKLTRENEISLPASLAKFKKCS